MLYVIATTAEATTDALSASQCSMDPLGVVLITCVTALGGGPVRDMLLGYYPLTWVHHPEYLALTVVAALVTMFIVPPMHHPRSLLLVLDTVGLVALTLIGCRINLKTGYSLLTATISGVITGVFGGTLHNTLCNDVPLIFRRELYTSVSFASAWCYLICMELELPSEQAMLIALLSDFLLRLLAIRFHWEMPKFVYQGDFDRRDKRLLLIDTFLQLRACPRRHGP